MKTFPTRVLGTGLLFALFAGSLTSGPKKDTPDLPATELEAAEPLEVGEVGLETLRRESPAWLGRRVRFVLQFRAPAEDWSPYMTRFGRGDWFPFEAWADERFTWDPAVFADPAPRLFARLGSEPHVHLARARRYERFEVTGIVREIFLDEPWIEVLEARPLEGMVGEGTLVHIGRAFGFIEKGQWSTALEQLERARAAPLPAHVARELDGLGQACVRAREAAAKARRIQR